MVGRRSDAAAEAYQGIVPADRWHDYYMQADELAAEMADGVGFSGYDVDGSLVSVMGVRHRRNVDLVRYAYVHPRWQGHGIGARRLGHLCRAADRPLLIGTWAGWAIHFYGRHGFMRVPPDDAVAPLLRAY